MSKSRLVKVMCKISSVLLAILFMNGTCLCQPMDSTNISKPRYRDRPSHSEFTRTAVKLNSLIFVGILNPAIEVKVLRNATFQLEALGIFANTNFHGTEKPLEMGAGFGEFRYYIKRAFDGFFAAPTIGFSIFKINKSLVPRYGSTYKKNTYQQGSNIMCGLTIGYSFNINQNWAIEASWGGGFQGAKYEGYKLNPDYVKKIENSSLSKDANEQIDENEYIMYVKNNGSAEWLPLFKCALSVVYKW